MVLSGLEAEINHTRSASPLEAEAVVDACATLLDRLDQGELDHLLSRFATPQLLDTLGRYRHTLQPESLRYKLAVELDGLWTGERPGPLAALWSCPWAPCSTLPPATWRAFPPSVPWRAC